MKITNKQGLPSAFVNMAQSDYKPTPKQYSATTLLKPTRQVILERKYGDQIEQDVANMIWMLFGQAVHYILEHHDETGWAEQKLKFTLDNGYTLSGIIDLYNEKTKEVVDYKTCTEWKFILKEFDDWKKQGLMYAWLLKKFNHECERVTFWGILKDYSPQKAKRDKTRPQFPIDKYSFEITEEDMQEIDKFIKEKLEDLKKAESLPDNELPLCSDEEMWREPSKFAVMEANKKKAKRVFKTAEEALTFFKANSKSTHIEERKGTPKKCFAYCSANQFCSFYRELMFGKNESEEENNE